MKQTPRSRKSREFQKKKNPKTPRHIIIEIAKVKERILKTTKGNTIYYIQNKPHKSISRFLSRKFAGQKRVAWYIQTGERKNLPIKNTLPGKCTIQNWKKISSFSNKQKLKEFVSTKPALQKNVKGTFLSWKESALIRNKKQIKVKISL